MDSIIIEVPQDIVSRMKLPKQQIREHLLVDLATSLYQQGILAFGPARKLCKMTKWEFIKELGVRKIERHYDEKNLEEDLHFAYNSQ